MKNNKCSSVVMISRSQLHPHPDNPRKDLGDLEELRESIREHGIMQNLTVIPEDEEFENFTILIGHRRYAASEGILTELPCVIVEDLSDREQIGIMLCENLQRNDLTFIEQAHGFQMMMDLGDTVESISEKTGFSEATVKHRLEIARLSTKAIQKSRAFQLSIQDFIELEKVPDVKTRNKIIGEAYSSDNIKTRVNHAVDEIKVEEAKKKLRPQLKPFGITENKGDTKHWKSGITVVVEENITHTKEIISKIKKLKDTKDLEWETGYKTFYLFGKKKQVKKDLTPEEKAAKQREANIRQINQIAREAVILYAAFISELPDSTFRSGTFSERRSLLRTIWDLYMDMFVYPMTTFHFKDDDLNQKLKVMLPDREIEWQMLAFIAGDLYEDRLAIWSGAPDESVVKRHKIMIDILERWGFSFPDDTFEPVVNGTSDLYKKEK